MAPQPLNWKRWNGAAGFWPTQPRCPSGAAALQLAPCRIPSSCRGDDIPPQCRRGPAQAALPGGRIPSPPPALARPPLAGRCLCQPLQDSKRFKTCLKHLPSRLPSLSQRSVSQPRGQVIGQGRGPGAWRRRCARRRISLSITWHAAASQPAVVPHGQLVGEGDVVVVAPITEGVPVHIHEVHVCAALRDAAQQLRRLREGGGGGGGGGERLGGMWAGGAGPSPAWKPSVTDSSAPQRTPVSWLLCSALARCFCSSTTCAASPRSRASSSRSSGVSSLRVERAHGGEAGGQGS